MSVRPSPSKSPVASALPQYATADSFATGIGERMEAAEGLSEMGLTPSTEADGHVLACVPGSTAAVTGGPGELDLGGVVTTAAGEAVGEGTAEAVSEVAALRQQVRELRELLSASTAELAALRRAQPGCVVLSVVVGSGGMARAAAP